MYLDRMTKDEFRKRVEEGAVVILPLGATEGHGPHLPLNTDTIQPVHVAEEVAQRTGALIAPPIYYGQCIGTRNYPGTISLSFDTLRALVREVLLELARNGVKRIVVLSGHAGRSHMVALREAALSALEEKDVRLMVLSDYDIAYKIDDPAIPEDDGHAGTIETARVMAIEPELVQELPEAFYPKFPDFQVVKDLNPYFGDCYHGDPKKATREMGERVNSEIVKRLAEMIEDF